MERFALTMCLLGLVLALVLLIAGRPLGVALIGVPLFVGGILGYRRGEYTAAYEQHQLKLNSERAKTSGISRWRNR
jgi:hypothetical protein